MDTTNHSELKDTIIKMLSEQKIEEYEEEVVTRLCDFVHNQVASTLEVAQDLAKDKNEAEINPHDIFVAQYGIKAMTEAEKPSVEELKQLAEQGNRKKLQKHFQQCGLRLPSGGYTLGKCNYQLKPCNGSNAFVL